MKTPKALHIAGPVHAHAGAADDKYLGSTQQSDGSRWDWYDRELIGRVLIARYGPGTAQERGFILDFRPLLNRILRKPLHTDNSTTPH